MTDKLEITESFNSSQDSESKSSFRLSADSDYISFGLKAGVCEERNKKYRRTMEVSFFL